LCERIPQRVVVERSNGFVGHLQFARATR
jgi:hypothetical protein